MPEFGPSGKSCSRSASEFKQGDVSVLDHRIHYLEAGAGDPVVLLHGMGGEGARWLPNIRDLAAHHRVIAPDQVGFGQSDKPLTAYHTGVFAGFLEGFLKQINVSTATLIGQSMGANVALYLAIRNPAMVNRLVLVNCNPFQSAAPKSEPNWKDRQMANAGTVEESRLYLKKLFFDHSHISDELVIENLILRLRSAFTIESIFRAEARGLGAISEQEMQTVEMPTLLIWGTDDPLAPLANAHRLGKLLPNCRLATINNAGHYPFLEHAAKFNSLTLEFLRTSSLR